MQSLLVGGSLLLAAMLLSSALGLLGGMHRPFDTMFDRLRASHILLFFDHQQNDVQQLTDWLEMQEEVASVNKPTPFYTINQLIYQGQEIDMQVQLTEHQEHHLGQDRVLIFKGNTKNHPDLGEVWLPNAIAEMYQITVGDTVGLPLDHGLYPLIVSATIVDPHYSNGLMNPTRAWVAPGSLPLFLPPGKLNQLMMGIRLNSAKDADALWARLHQEFDYVGSNLQYRLFKSVFLSFYQIISVVLLVFSFLAMVVSGFIILATISNAILADYRQIGILKAQGFSPQNIVWVYIMQYVVIAFFSLPTGLLGSYFLTRALLGSLIKSIGLVNLEFSLAQPLLITFFGFLLLILLLTWFGSRKAGQIKAVAAIRFGHKPLQSTAKRGFSILHITALPLTLKLGLSWLSSHRQRAFFMSCNWVFAVFMVVFALNISHSFKKMRAHQTLWGFENADLIVTRNTQKMISLQHETFVKLLQQEDQIQSVTPFSYHFATIPSNADQAPQDLVGKAYESGFKDTGLENLEGRHPESPNEISICIGTSQQYQKGVGDTFNLFVEGQMADFTITGIYQDISNLGQGFRLSSTAIKKLNPIYQPEQYALRLKTGTDINAFKRKLQEKFAETITIDLAMSKRKNIVGIASNMRSSLILIALFFLSVLFIAIFNDTLLSLKSHSREFGIFKAIGMTPVELRTMLIYKNLGLSLPAILIGIPLALWLSPVLMGGLTGGMGLVNFPFIVNAWLTLGVIPMLLGFGSGTVWMASKGLLGLKVRSLVVHY